MFFIFSIFFKNITGQSHLYLDAAQIFSTFKFSSDNSQNNSAPGSGYSTIPSTAFGIGYEYADSNGLLILAGLGARKSGSTLVYNKTSYTWNLQYLDLRAGIGYQYNKWRIRPYAIISPFYATLLNARQTIGLNYYDIKSSNAIKNNDFGLFLSAGFNIPLTRLISIYLDYNYILGLRNIETTESQYLYNRGSAFKLGLLFNISATKVKHTPSGDSTYVLQTAPHSGTDSLNKAKDKQNSVNSPIDSSKTISTGLAKKDTITTEKITTLTKDTLSSFTKTAENKQNVGSSDKLDEKQLQDISKIASDQNITFKIQIVAVKNELPANNFLLKNATRPVKKIKSPDGLIRYYSGSFKTYEKAHFELNKMKSNGIAADGFIVAFQNEKKITVADAKELLK